MYKSKNAFSRENIVTKARMLVPEKLQVQGQEYFFMMYFT